MEYRLLEKLFVKTKAEINKPAAQLGVKNDSLV